MYQSQFIEMFGQSTLGNGVIGDYLLLKAGKAMPADRISFSKADGMFPCFGGNGIRGYVDSYNYDGDYAIIGRQGALCGNVCLAQGKFYATEHAVVVTPKVIVDTTWLFYALNQMNLNQYARGVAQPGLAVNELEKLPFSVPDSNKQIEFSNIAKQADKSKFDGFKSQFIEMFGNVDNNSYHYPIKNIGSFADCFAGATPSTAHPEYWDEGTIRWMSSGEVHKGHVTDTDARITDIGYKSASTKMVPIHSIVIALAGQGKTRGTVAVTEVELCTNQSLCAIIPDETIHYEYLYHNLRGRYSELRGLAGDVNGRGGLNLKIIQKIPVIVPPMLEQLRFVDIAKQADKSKSINFS